MTRRRVRLEDCSFPGRAQPVVPLPIIRSRHRPSVQASTRELESAACGARTLTFDIRRYNRRVKQRTTGRRSNGQPGYRRIVAKVGTNLLTAGSDQIDERVMAALVSQVVRLIDDGRDVVIVTSGAIAAGRERLAASRSGATSRSVRCSRRSDSRSSCRLRRALRRRTATSSRRRCSASATSPTAPAT